MGALPAPRLSRFRLSCFGFQLFPAFCLLAFPLPLPSPPMTRIGIRAAGNRLDLPPALWNSCFLKACRGEAVPYTPVWLMRQAGRYMKEYRALRSGRTFLELCKDPPLAAEVTVFARERLGVDAAIVFSDILVVLEAMGLPLTFTVGDGPSLPAPIADAAAIDALRPADAAADDLGYVYDTVRRCVADLPGDIPLIGFCGRAVHPRQLRHRRRREPAVRANKGFHVQPAGAVA